MSELSEVGAILKVAGEIAGGIKVVELSFKAYGWFRKARFHQDLDEAKALLGLHLSNEVAYRHDSVHPLYSTSTELHPDNLAGLITAAGNEYLLALEQKQLCVLGTITSTLNSNLVLIGSPTAEGLSRPTFGYEPDIDADSLVLGAAPIELPFRWVLSKNRIDERAQARRYVAGKGLVARPNWRIEADNQMFVPAVDSEGLLSVDYLLVTRVRNYLSPQALDEGKFLVSLGGTHGTATRAIELLLRDRDVLRQIGRHLPSHPAAYQLLLAVGKMKHDKQLGTRATKIELVGEPLILPDREDIWLHAHKLARKNLEEWFATM
ncbi:hypothetical protein [Nitrolancea hollandica]|uniref:Uncharacterized protein n=1 Tax=Nitrolancea hollandica Lb TaxID=1129897 RepID=I4EC83_9BACT|nr:hypothetical protein [Nitrolancea hollandica]CCF82295.1 hypothetical protein NITHO_100011 [Nitrolancea hollandica Lb]